MIMIKLIVGACIATADRTALRSLLHDQSGATRTGLALSASSLHLARRYAGRGG